VIAVYCLVGLALQTGRTDLRPGEVVDGAVFVGLKPVPFESEQAARTHARAAGASAQVIKQEETWVVLVPQKVNLMQELEGRPLDPQEKLENGILHTPTGLVLESKAAAEEFAKTNKQVERIEEVELAGRAAFFARWTKTRDLVPEARLRLRDEGLADRWLLRNPPTPWSLGSFVARGDLSFDVAGKGLRLRGLYDSSKERGIEVLVDLVSDPGADHAFIGVALDAHAQLTTRNGGKLFELIEPDAWALYWKHRPGVYFSIAAAGKVPNELANAFLSRYPPAWDEGFRFNVSTWARQEAERVILLMERVLADPPPLQNSPPPFSDAYVDLMRWFDVPLTWDITKNTSPEERQRHLAQVKAWWNKEKAKVQPRNGAPVEYRQALLESRKK
jgi:hypothetical protein